LYWLATKSLDVIILPSKILFDLKALGKLQTITHSPRGAGNIHLMFAFNQNFAYSDIYVSENTLSIKANIHGTYPEEKASEKIIENDFFNQISRYLD